MNSERTRIDRTDIATGEPAATRFFACHAQFHPRIVSLVGSADRRPCRSLIHLINLMRHRRVHWAAMEFLLASQKRHQKSILFKELLLLLLRMAAIAAVVLVVAQPLVRNQWAALLGGTKTHHIVLLDDSFSMSDHWADTSAFDQAKQVVGRLAAQAGTSGYSANVHAAAVLASQANAARGTQPDMLQEPLDAPAFNRSPGASARPDAASADFRRAGRSAGGARSSAAQAGRRRSRRLSGLRFSRRQWHEPQALADSCDGWTMPPRNFT